MKITAILVFLFSLFMLTSCEGIFVKQGDDVAISDETEVQSATATQTMDLRAVADTVMAALAQKDLKEVANFVHPKMGVRFSPYAFVREDHQVFKREALPELMASPEIYTWGNFDGSGEPIEMTFSEYYERFVYSADFLHAEVVAVNERIGQGNSIDNIHEFYPGSSFVEYHFSGFDPQYEGMDWQSLRLVFLQEDGIWYLVGIVHDEWTI